MFLKSLTIISSIFLSIFLLIYLWLNPVTTGASKNIIFASIFFWVILLIYQFFIVYKIDNTNWLLYKLKIALTWYICVLVSFIIFYVLHFSFINIEEIDNDKIIRISQETKQIIK